RHAPPEEGPVVGVRVAEGVPPFDGRLFVYRTGESSFEREPYAEFARPPAENVAAVLRSHLRHSGLFRSVADPRSAIKPNLIAEVSVTKLYGDFHDLAKPAAALSIRFVFLENSRGTPGNVIHQTELTREVPIKTNTAAAVMAGWNQCLKQILTDLAAELKTALARET